MDIKSSEISNILKKQIKSLNLKQHIVSTSRIYGPGDIEGHMGTIIDYCMRIITTITITNILNRN